MFLKEKVDMEAVVRKSKALVIIFAILAVALGVCFIIAPLITGGILIWVMIGLFGIAGIVAILRFIFPGKGRRRDGLSLAGGILIVILVTCIILCGVFAQPVIIDGQKYSGFAGMTGRLLFFFAIFFGVFLIADSIYSLCVVHQYEVEQRGWMIAKGVCGIIVGVCLIWSPMVALFAACLIEGIYLVIMGIAAIVFVCKISSDAKKVKKAVEEHVEEHHDDVIDNK